MRPAFFLTHLKKDLQLEWRSKDAINSMLFFALLVVVLFSLAFDPTRAVSRQIAGGILCVATMFAAVSSLNQAWARELRNQVLDALRMTPAPGASLFLGKALANFLFVTVVELVLAPVFVVFYNLRAIGNGWLLLLVLPLLLFPIFIPALLGMVMAATAILTGANDPIIWIKMLGAYDVIFTTVCLMLFEVILHAE